MNNNNLFNKNNTILFVNKNKKIFNDTIKFDKKGNY